MKRWFLATAVLLGGTAGMASADYIVIIANVGQVRDKTPAGPGQMGVPPGMGNIGMPPGMGNIGMPPGMGNIGKPPGMGNIGMPPGMGNIGMPPNQMGSFPPNQMGSFPPNQMGSFPPGQAGGLLGQQGGTAGAQDGQPILIATVVELDDAPFKELVKRLRVVDLTTFPGAPTYEVHDHWGAVKLLNFSNPAKPGPDVQVIPLQQMTVKKRYEAEAAKVFKDKAGQKPAAEDILALAEWALSHDLNDKFVEVMKKLAEDNKELPAVKAFLQVQADLDRPTVQGSAADDLKKRLGDYKDATQKDGKGHYTLFHNLGAADDPAIQERLDKLEDSLRTFYYWFALKGHALAMPKERLPALLTSRDAEFHRYRDSLSSPTVVADGFFARRENLAVFCARPLDERYELLDKATMHLWTQGYNRIELLTGKDNKGYPTKTDSHMRSYVGTLALLMKSLEDESERASISHDSTRQLLFASGLLPRSVTTPEWVQFGMGSFFETPMHAPWPTPTAPNSAYYPVFREELGEKGKKFEGDPLRTMRKIVTDGYFRDLSPDAVKKNTPEVLKARAATWSLMYYLAKQKNDNLRRYFQLLGEMPRDLELDDRVLWETFARAFDAFDPATKRVDDAKLMNTVAAPWQSFVLLENLESADLVKKLQDTLKEINTKEEGPQPPPGANP